MALYHAVVYEPLDSPVERLPTDLMTSQFHEFEELVMRYALGMHHLAE